MERYTTPTRINGAWREALIYKSETLLTFESLERHTQTDELGDKTVITTYVTEPYIYRQFEPTEKDSHYYYWFVIKVVERETVTTNGERVAALEEQLAAADKREKRGAGREPAVFGGLYSRNGGGRLCLAE